MSPIISTKGGLSSAGYGQFSLVGGGSSFDSIATVTVGSGGTSSISFTSIPSTYKHLQIRGIYRSSRASASGRDAALVLNYNGTTSTYVGHNLIGDGASASASYNSSSQYANNLDVGNGNNATAGIFSVAVIDILDYANTSKNKVMRGLAGVDLNGSGAILFGSGMWVDTTAINQIVLTTVGAAVYNFQQYSQFALYGIK